ncbi:MAG: dipeptidase [Longimicrobiales bacterium]|nr:dipeptidase [Longimicrobiales bacterium]
MRTSGPNRFTGFAGFPLVPGLFLVVGSLLAGPSTAVAQVETPDELRQHARAIHERVITLDTHTDIDPDDFLEGRPNYTTDLEETQVDLPSMEEGGLDAVFFSLYQGQEQDFSPEGYARAFQTALDKVAAVRRLTSVLAPDRIGLAVTAADVRRIAGEGRLVALMGMENGYALGEDPGNLELFAELGTRYLSLVHNGHNQLADSHTGEAEGEWRWNGLSPLGREVVAEANRLGVVLDVSHPSKEANLETMELSRAPVMASHSSARALADHTRNMDDEQLLALQENGGVIQIVAFDSYLVPPEEEPATVSDLVDHVDYVVDLIGIDHVGISSDFDGGGGIEGWNDASETFNVTLELVRRGYSEEQIARIWSGNVLRVMDEARRVAAGM